MKVLLTGIRIKHVAFFVALIFLSLYPGISFSLLADTQQSNVKIAIRAHSGEEAALKKWSATADYLSQAIEGYVFTILPIVGFEDMRKAIDSQEVEFVLVNPSTYIELEESYGVTRIATLINRRGKGVTDKYGAVIFTRSDRNNIKSLDDVKGRSMMGVHQEAFGGWRMALGELMNHGIHPDKDSSEILFAGTQESVVFAVRDGKADVGTVRTGILEKLAEDGEIDLEDFKILGSKEDGFHLPHSTRLYPEWPFARLKGTPDSLAHQVLIALLQMKSNTRAALAGDYTGWTTPLDYSSIHDLMKRLHVGPYREYGKVTFQAVIKTYWYWAVLILIAALIGFITIAYISRTNFELSRAQKKLRREIEERKKTIDELQEALSEIHNLRGILPICSYCKSIRNDEGYYEQIEAYIHKHSDVDFSHTVCPACMKEHYPVEYASINSDKNKE